MTSKGEPDRPRRDVSAPSPDVWQGAVDDLGAVVGGLDWSDALMLGRIAEEHARLAAAGVVSPVPLEVAFGRLARLCALRLAALRAEDERFRQQVHGGPVADDDGLTGWGTVDRPPDPPDDGPDVEVVDHWD